MGKENRERLEDLQGINAQLQEENKHLKEQVQIFNQRMVEMEKNLERSTRLLLLLKKQVVECQYSLIVVIVDGDKSRV
jgi:predicted nuclease with TOPRIM domain